MNWYVGVLVDTYRTQANSTVSITKLAVFLCPSDTPPSYIMTPGPAPLNSYTATGNSYFACMGSTLEFAGEQNGGPPNGMFQYVGTVGNGRIGVRNIRDGLTNSIAFGEWRMGSGIASQISVPQDVVYLGSLPSGTTRNNGTLNMPNPTLVASFPAWLNSCAKALTTSRST